jgi:hypothetical protein
MTHQINCNSLQISIFNAEDKCFIYVAAKVLFSRPIHCKYTETGLHSELAKSLGEKGKVT